MTYTAAVVVASNRAAAGVYEDATGPLLVAALREWGFATPDPVVDQHDQARGRSADEVHGAGGQLHGRGKKLHRTPSARPGTNARIAASTSG